MEESKTIDPELIGASDNPLHKSVTDLFNVNMELLEAMEDAQGIIERAIARAAGGDFKRNRNLTEPMHRAVVILIFAREKARGLK